MHVDVERVPLANGDRVLRCSDGLTDTVTGGRDNITVVVAIYTWHDTTTNGS